ncbi:mucin-4-like isoform X2 [Grus americana]|uniref:mucin-4-like isoform X2 n=1 Tax=Grus americana TaxID=9117 RepID=UPI00240869F9|nr:mucin-4-like isoform X2 [Grus americana]
MGIRGWTLSTFVGCCIWILHGLGAAAAVPATTEGPFAVGTASPIVAETEGPYTLVMGTAETSTTVADAELAESILTGSPSSPSFPPGAEPDALVTAASKYSSTVPTLTNVTKPLNTSQDIERGLAAPTTATTAAAMSAQHPAVTPEAELDVTGATPDVPLGTTPLFADVKEDILAAVTREGADLDPTTGVVSLHTTPPLAAGWEAQPTAGSPVGAGVTALLSQELTTATGAVEEGITLPVDIQSKASDDSSSPSPGAGGLLTTQQDGAVSGAVGITPEPAGETALAAEERPSASVPGDAGDAVNGAFSTASSSRLPPESVTVSGTVANPGDPSLLPNQAVLSPTASLVLAGGGDGDGQGAPDTSSDGPDSALLLAASDVPAVTGDTATSLLTPRVPIDAGSDMNPPALATVLPTGDIRAVGLAEPSLQPAPWQIPAGEQPPLLTTALPSSTDTSSVSGAVYLSPGASYPPPGTGASTLPAADDGAEIPVSPDLGATPEAPMSPSLGGLTPWGMSAGASQGASGPSTGLNSALDALNPASFVSDGLAWRTTGVPPQVAEGAGDTRQAVGPEDGNPYGDTQSDTSSSAFSTQQDPANTGELPAGGTGGLANAELSPPSALGDGTEAGAAPALGQVSPPGSAPPGSAGLEPEFLGAEGPGDLPNESPSTPGAAYPPLGAVTNPVSGAETPVSPNLSAAQGAPVSPSLGGSQPWGAAVGAPQGAGLPGADGPGTGLTSAWGVPSSASYGPAGPPSPALGDQLGTNLELPAAEGHGAGTTEPVLGGAGSGTGFEPSLISAAGSGTAAGMDQLPGASSSSGPSSPSDVVAASSILRGDEAGPIPAAASGPHSLSPASPDSETGPELIPVQVTESTGNAAQAGNPESESPYMEMSPSAFSTQQDPANTGELPAGGTGGLANAELSPPSALGDEAEAGAAPALGQVSPPGSAPPGSAGLEPEFLGAEGPGDLPNESPSTPGAAYPPLGAVTNPVSGAETPVSPNLSAAQGAPVSPSLGGSQPWGAAVGAPQGAGLPGADGPGTGLTSAWGVPSSASYGPAGPPSPALGDQLGTNLELPAAEGHGAGTTEPVLGGAGSGTGFEPSLISAAGSGTAAGMDQLPGASSSSGPSSPSGVVAAPSISNPASPSALGEVGGAPGVPQPSLGAGPGVPPAAGEGAGEVAGDRESPGQSQASAGGELTGSGDPDREMGAMLQSASSSPSTEGSSSPGTAGEAANGASLPGAGGAGGGLSTGLEAAGPEEPPVSVPGIQSGANLGLSDAKLSQVNVVELPGGASVNGGPSPGVSLGEGAGAIIQIASGALAPSALTSSQEMQSLVPVAPDGSGVSDGTAASLAASLLPPGHGLSSGLAPNGDPHSAPSTQSGSRALAPGAPGGLAGDAGGTQTSSLEDEVASGMPVPLGEASPRVPTSPNAALALPSAPQRENAAEGVSASPGLSAPLSTRESVAGSSAGGRGELGAAVLGGPAVLLPPHQLGSSGDPFRDADSLVPGEASAVVPGAMAGRGDMAQLLPSTTGARAAVETPTRFPPQGSPGLSGLPPTRIAAGSPGSKAPGPGPASGSSPAALQPFLGSKATTSLANGAPAVSESSLPTVFPGQGGARGGSPATTRPVVSCSPAAASPAPPAPLPGVREVLPKSGAATVTSRTSSLVFPALPGRPVATPTPLPSPTVAAVPLYGYGARENDREYVERRVDFNSPLFKPETGFPFGKTLRDSLYFTDNGQIIFPASDNSIFTYPNPPPRGFNGHEDVPMIAVFWDNADFSRGVGTTFYQEFPTLNTAKPPFVRDVEAKVRRYLRSSYSAAWTLKITWEKAPAYAARTDTRRTITYQAVLTTDGFRSYVLMLYQEGGMRWDYTRLAATNVLIGYTSGDGFYHNDDLTQRPPAAKYRPDRFKGYNTDLRGLSIYKLESRVGINYRLKCLAWTGWQQEPRTWSQGLPTCPCSLQQGQQDPRFKSSRGGWWAARVSMLHSASPNKHGAGVRCLYNSQSQLIEGRQERYWRSSRQASPYRDQELKLYDWCCNQAGSAHVCARYSEKRPKISCDGYQSPGTGSSEEADSDSEEQRDGADK